MKKPTVKDATKQEFVEFFTQSMFGKSGLHQFERWLSDKRYKVLDDKLSNILDLMEEENKKMYKCTQEALKETDMIKKRDLYYEACKHQEKWDDLCKQSDKLQKEIDEFLGL